MARISQARRAAAAAAADLSVAASEDDNNNETSTSQDDPSDPLAGYGDHSSSYWPSGWNFAKMRGASVQDLLGLPEGELAKMQAGLRDKLGEDGLTTLTETMFAQSQAAKPADTTSDNTETQVPTLPPDWLRIYDRRMSGHEWGFVVLRTGLYDGDDEQAIWDDFKTKFEQVVKLPFKADAGGKGVAEAETKFSIRWVEDKELARADAKVLREKIASISKDLPGVYPSNVFFVATPQAVRHLETCKLPTTTSEPFRTDAPYVVAVAASPDPGEPEDEAEGFKECFKAPIEVLISDLWNSLVGMDTPLRQFTRYVKGVELKDGEELVSTLNEGDSNLSDMRWDDFPGLPARAANKRRRVV